MVGGRKSSHTVRPERQLLIKLSEFQELVLIFVAQVKGKGGYNAEVVLSDPSTRCYYGSDCLPIQVHQDYTIFAEIQCTRPKHHSLPKASWVA